MSKSAISKIIKRYRETGSVEAKRNSGRPKKFTEREERSLVRNCITNPGLSSKAIAGEYNQSNESENKTISASMVRKILFRRNLRSYRARKKPFLSDRMIKQRLEFCKRYKNFTADDWSKFIFSDESYIEINHK